MCGRCRPDVQAPEDMAAQHAASGVLTFVFAVKCVTSCHVHEVLDGSGKPHTICNPTGGEGNDVCPSCLAPFQTLPLGSGLSFDFPTAAFQ